MWDFERITSVRNAGCGVRRDKFRFSVRYARRSGVVALGLALGLAVHGVRAQDRSQGPSAAALAQNFRVPPDIARPRVYWYWQNGNITKDGLTKDLEWMHRVGIGGVETFDVAVTTPT